MNESDIAAIERELSIKLPLAYVQTMLKYPIDMKSTAYAIYFECALPNEKDRVIEDNKELREHWVKPRPWPNDYFTFGHDGGGNPYYIKVNNGEAVYMAEHENGDLQDSERIFDTFEEWLKDSMSEEENDKSALDEEKEQRNEAWWKFWK